MKFFPLFLSILLVLTPLHGQATKEKSVTAQSEFTEKLQSDLVSTVKATAPDKLAELIASPEFSQKLLRWKFHHTLSPETLAKFSSQRDPLLRSSFLKDDKWLAGFLNSGPIANPDKALEYLSFLYKKDPKIATNSTYQKIATSAALEFARRLNPKKSNENTVWSDTKNLFDRYNYFKTSYDKKLLNAQFNKLDFWDMRILTGTAPQSFGTVESLTWQRDNVRLPAQAYTGACWQAPWRRHNEWGDSIHGRDYYTPFQDLFETRAEMTKNIGAVCGGLSTYGAHAAIANGIPALTMGEPAHCAYAVRTTTDKWVPSYSLSWKRGCHWSFYGEKWSLLILTQNNFSDKEKLETSTKYSWLAQLADLSGEKNLARSLYLKSIMSQPKNYAHWTEYIDRELKEDSLSTQQWAMIHTQLCNAYAKDFPEVCWMLLDKKIYPKLLPLITSPKEKLAEIEKFHATLDKMSPAQWDYQDALEKQYNLAASEYAELKPFVQFLIKTHLSSVDYGAPTLSWCNEKMSIIPERQKEFLAMIAGASGGEDQGDGSEKAITALAQSIMSKAEESGNIESFQAAGALVKDKFKPILPEFEPFPGELLSSGGLLKLSSVSGRWGEPWQHWGVIEECGGDFHTEEKLDNESATVLTKRVGTLTGVVIIHRKSGMDRGNNCIIEASIDGTNWQEIGKIDKMQRINRIDLQGKNIQAKYVRITRKGKGAFHLQGILIYGNKAS